MRIDELKIGARFTFNHMRPTIYILAEEAYTHKKKIICEYTMCIYDCYYDLRENEKEVELVADKY